jgi:HAMP domain-containing protein
MPGILAIITSVIFSLLFSFFITVYYTSPLNRIIAAIKHIQPKDRKITPTVKSNDELKNLEREVNNMIERLSKS